MSDEAPAVDTVSSEPKKKYKGKTRPGLSVMQKFWERMKREGRKPLWAPTLKKIMTGPPEMKYGAAKWEAARQLGYEGPENEHRLHAEFLSGEARKVEEEKAANIAAAEVKLREEQRLRDEATADARNFEAACAKLPDKAPVAAEIDWVRAHPAMSRQDRMPGGIGHVLITPDDIESPPHGCAPSKGAVAMLQHYANNPREFFKTLLSEQKKITGETGQAKQDEDVEMAEVERLLKEVQIG
jgi:hypothetical protein